MASSPDLLRSPIFFRSRFLGPLPGLLFSFNRCESYHHRHRFPSSANSRVICIRRTRTFQIRASASSTLTSEWSGFSVTDAAGELELDMMPVDINVTRNLEPALTLMQGVERIKEAVAELRAAPPVCTSGVIRFQVRVPPSVKAANWLQCQCKSENFPQFHISAKCKSNIFETKPLDGLVGISGVGAAVFYHGPFHFSEDRSLVRYLSIDSPLLRAYGFVGFKCSTKLSLIKHGDEHFYIFIPQIELDEFEGISVLALTMIWDDYRYHTLQEAIQSAESNLNQVSYLAVVEDTYYRENLISYLLGCSDFVEANDTKVVYMNAENPVQHTCFNDHRLKYLQQDHHSCFRLSSTTAFTVNMAPCCGRSRVILEDSPNINIVWASLIIEECIRLGLTYFCIAPGSRSSPLAISAATHPLATCISIFDERSLAFHAVGYAKGSYKPAVVITSSGTAVSNLFPAVVEASQDFIPVLLLTADRPPELLDVGANQAINQVDHFGKFVRYFFSLPPPSDEIPARVVLTTVDSAIYMASQSPRGPVHINCPFREPLEITNEWSLSCLKGLDQWVSGFKPFTTYVNLQSDYICDKLQHEITEVVQKILRAERGLLLVGSLSSEDEIWATLLLAKHLSWPVVADILSGLRLRKILGPFSQHENEILFIDHFDHALLADSFRVCAVPDVVIQLGGRITSKRVMQFLEHSLPISYILVEKHPCRHDPLHLVTHRIQSTITALADSLLKVKFTRKISKWRSVLETAERMVKWELTKQIHMEERLTEPHVAQEITSALQHHTALFIGNSMVIRDVDMYGTSFVKSNPDVTHLLSRTKFIYHGIRVAGNRGASGIDGLLSSAIGFAVGCGKRVLCVIGDVSFLHDTNGLAVLKDRIRRKPMTIIVINNHGGAIFSLLPIAERAPSNVLEKYFYTSHNISIAELSAAHSVNHLRVRSKMELQNALVNSQKSHTDYIIEVESSIRENSSFHSMLRKIANQAASQALRSVSLIPDDNTFSSSIGRIGYMQYSSYRIQLSAPLTVTPVTYMPDQLYKEGFVVTLTLDDGSIGMGEVSPIGIHKEDIHDVEEQLRFIHHIIAGSELCCRIPLLKGSFSSWLQESLGIMPSSLFPSVRCGIEMAVLNALANKFHCTLTDLILESGVQSTINSLESTARDHKTVPRSAHVPICALVDSGGTPKEVSHVVSEIVKEGYTTIKLKVARRADPREDAAVIREIRNTVGNHINIRVDANRKWAFEKAVLFGSCVKDCRLQYIEEPVQCESDIIKFCEETCLPVALDETLDNITGDHIDALKGFAHPGIVAVVIKPSVVGGFEIASLLTKWAQQHSKLVVISSAFESSLGLSAYLQFAHYVECQKTSLFGVTERYLTPSTAHGLGTQTWLKEDVSSIRLDKFVQPHGDCVGVSVGDAASILHGFQINKNVVQRCYKGLKITSYQDKVDVAGISCSFRLLEAKMDKDIIMQKPVVIFLHGFMGTSEEWIPIMKALSYNACCISIDLPGHGQSKILLGKEKEDLNFSMESLGDVLHRLFCGITNRKVILVGYSMGARIALYMSLKYKEKVEGIALISGSPGLKDQSARRIRSFQDDIKACFLEANGLKCFQDMWYESKLWDSLREHPRFNQILHSRENHVDVKGLSKALSHLSIGRQPSLWEDLKQSDTPTLLIVGEKDAKFRDIAKQMYAQFNHASTDHSSTGRDLWSVAEIPGCGHAAHLEDSLAVIHALSKFLRRICHSC